MYALAIETSGRVGSVALARRRQVLAEEQFPHGLRHAAGIIPVIDRLCQHHNVNPEDLRHVYVSAGPGSFTGLRIAITLAKTLAYARGLKIVAVPTVRVLVENAPADARHAAIVLDAKRDQIYTALFERSSGDWIEREPAHLDTLAAVLARAPRPLHLLGEGIPAHACFIPDADDRIIATPPESWQARAGVVAKLGMDLAERGEFSDPFRLIPIYIRLPEAEEKWLARQGG
jgi:tRNA threonylcarbamoyladenosine biosynthesis protein TsaB